VGNCVAELRVSMILNLKHWLALGSFCSIAGITPKAAGGGERERMLFKGSLFLTKWDRNLAEYSTTSVQSHSLSPEQLLLDINSSVLVARPYFSFDRPLRGEGWIRDEM
jgi:hypothetical protein